MNITLKQAIAAITGLLLLFGFIYIWSHLNGMNLDTISERSFKGMKDERIYSDCEIAYGRKLYSINEKFKQCQLDFRNNNLIASLTKEHNCTASEDEALKLYNSCLQFAQSHNIKIGQKITLKESKYDENCDITVLNIRWTTGSLLDKPYLDLDVKCNNSDISRTDTALVEEIDV